VSEHRQAGSIRGYGQRSFESRGVHWNLDDRFRTRSCAQGFNFRFDSRRLLWWRWQADGIGVLQPRLADQAGFLRMSPLGSCDRVAAA
jgi:hypothetical protein